MERFIKSTAGRRWLYGVALALVALAAAYGLITDELSALWVGVIAALLGLPVAAGNVTNAGAESGRHEVGYPVADPHDPTTADPERYNQ